MPVGALAVGGDRGPFLEIATADLGIALLQQPLVALGDGIDRIDRGRLSLELIACELVLATLTVPDASEPLGQAEGVVKAAVETHAAERVVDMRGVARQENAVFAICRGDALADAIDRTHDDLIRLRARQEVLQAALNA